jgi:hypothetical protein
VERKFQKLYGKIRSMLNWARLTAYLRSKQWAQCSKLVTQLENIIYKPSLGTSAHNILYKTETKLINHLRTFGEIAIFHDSHKNQGKLENRGKPGIFIGYPEDHSNEIYEFLDILTKSLLLSRNYKWMNQSYGEYMNLETEWIPRTELTRNVETLELEFDALDLNQEEENLEIIINDQNDIQGNPDKEK